MRLNKVSKLFIAVSVSELAGIVGSIFTVSSTSIWFDGIVKPALNPPSWVFGPVWTVLYALMGISAFLVWNKGWERKEVRVALGVFGIQLFLNVIWSIIFFGLQSPGWAFIDIVLLWLAIVWTMFVFYEISRLATYLLIPYLLWVSFATYLNYFIWILN
jgi:translocator protein